MLCVQPLTLIESIASLVTAPTPPLEPDRAPIPAAAAAFTFDGVSVRDELEWEEEAADRGEVGPLELLLPLLATDVSSR